MVIAYLNIFIYFMFSLLLSIIIVLLTMVLIPRSGDIEKVSAYECGFHPFDDSRATFDVRFYLVAIMFIIFDLEIIFLFPWSLNLNLMGWLGYYFMLYFIYILLIGFVYEWKKGALEWM
jgi:NADH:ubiquinone oxidoreductase subunit 3 (subunit A)